MLFREFLSTFNPKILKSISYDSRLPGGRIMISIIGAGVFSIVIIISILIICGLPLGELTMGGQYKVYPPKMRIVLVSQLIVQVLFVVNCFADVNNVY